MAKKNGKPSESVGVHDKQVVCDLLEINRRLSLSLWACPDVHFVPKGLSPRLIFPQYRSGGIRISEREALILCCGLLNGLNYYYSIETPTNSRFSFTGKSPNTVSARTDLTLFKHDGDRFVKAANIEFKAKNCPREHIRKDIEKFVKERLVGNWFHVLDNENRATLPRLFDKFTKSFEAPETGFRVAGETSIVFCFCILKQNKQAAYIRHFHYTPSIGSRSEYLRRFFTLDSSWQRYTLSEGV